MHMLTNGRCMCVCPQFDDDNDAEDDSGAGREGGSGGEGGVHKLLKKCLEVKVFG